MKRSFVLLLVPLALATITVRAQNPQRIAPRLIGFDVVEASILDMQTAMQRGRVTSKELVLQSFARIAFYKDLLNPVISLYRDFYVFQYATSFAASSALAEKVKAGDAEARKRYLAFL